MLENYKYVPLHVHSDYSNITLIDSINRIPELVDYCLELGLGGMALTDHETLAGTVKYITYYNSLTDEQKENFKPIIGDEIYLVDEVRQAKMPHFLLLAKNRQGYELLKQISTQAWENSYNKGKITRRPIRKVELEEIVKDSKGNLVATTACLAGEFATLVLELLELESATDSTEAEIKEVKGKIVRFVKWGIATFGKENFYIEVQPSNQRDQILFNMKAKELAKVFDLKMVVTTDAHYLKEEDRAIHSAFLMSKDLTRDSAQFYRSAYIMDAGEIYSYRSIKKVFSEEELIEMLDNTVSIANEVEVYDVFHNQDVPYVDRSAELEQLLINNPTFKIDTTKYKNITRILNEQDPTTLYWWYRIYEFLDSKGKLNDEYVSRIDLEAEELFAISDKLKVNLFSYYVTMTKIQDIAWDDAGAIIGLSRGSVAGFLSAWALEIQGVDSIEYNLPHWRHISKERPELPDIDFDTPPSRRQNLILATKNYFGKNKVLNIATFKTEGSKSSIQTACRGYRSEEYPYGIDNDEADFLSSFIKYERGFAWSISDTYYGNVSKDRDASKEFVKQIDQYPGLLEIALKVEGLISGRSIHASGVYIYQDDYTKYNAMMKAPNGQPTTQFDMSDSDYQGGLKFDYLTVTAMDTIQTTLGLLIEEGYVEEKETLKETYNSILAVDKLVDSEDYWKHAYNREMLSLFQFDTAVGGDAISKVKPHNVLEAAHVNSLMRLMATERGGEAPTDKFVRFKGNIQHWYEEMKQYKLTNEEVKVLEKHLKPVYGVAATQEELMVMSMDKEIAGFSLTQANKLRKAVAKKKADVMLQVRTEFFESGEACGTSKNMLNYVWDYVAMPQAGYSFSSLHTTGYTLIALQELTLFHNYPSIFWNTAVLIVNSASVEEVIDPAFVEIEYDEDGEIVEPKKKNDTVDYGKIAKSIGEIVAAGTEVAPPHVNTAMERFQVDVNNNRILYSLRALSGVGEKELQEIIEKRPFTSFEDFLERTKIKKPSVVSLIKSGAFDELEDKAREEIMIDYIKVISEPKKKLNLQNFRGLITKGMIPTDLNHVKSLFEFNRYIRQKQFKVDGKLIIDERAQRYLSKNYSEIYSTAELEENNNISINEKAWKKIYDKGMDDGRNWLKNNQEEQLTKYNDKLFDEQWEKYASGTLSKWEMDSMCYYSHDHELAITNFDKYGISHFNDLPENPIVETFFRPQGRAIPIYKIDKIVGTCIDRNNMKNTFTLLTDDGAVVDVRLSAEHFAYYNKQLSEVVSTGKKEVREKSWFTRGNKIMVVGYRRGNAFVPKRYKRTPEQHRLYLITDVDNENGNLMFTSQRWGATE